MLVPVKAMLVSVSVLLPVLVKVTVCAADELPTLVWGKVRPVEGERLNTGPVLPVRAAV